MLMTEKRIFRLAHDEARRRAVECILQAPEGYVVRVSPPTRSLEQNAALHAALQDISRQLTWCGERLGIDEWKRLLTAAWCRAEQQPVRVVRALDGHGLDVLYRRTSRMTKAELSSLLDYLHAWGTDQGVVWSDIPAQQHEEVA